MTKSSRTAHPTSQSTDQPPRAIIHKQILDAAEATSTITVNELAAQIPGATATLVKRVLKEYDTDLGDTSPADEPAMDPDDTTDAETPQPGSTPSHDGDTSTVQSSTETDETPSAVETVPSPAELSEDQLSVLRAIRERPAATQRDIAEEFGVSRATISQRVNAIDGFEWRDRYSFIQEFFDMPSDPASDGDTSSTGLADELAALQADVDALTREVATLADRVEALETGTETAEAPVTDAELASKIVHACATSEAISEEEQLRIIRAYLE